MKKNVIFRIAAIVLMCTLVTACFASSTFAKYTSKATSTATATVAKWDVTVTDKNGDKQLGVAQDDTLEFNFVQAYANLVNNNGNDPKPTVVDKYLAPGTEGSFDVKITNESDTAARYTIKLAYADTDLVLPDSFKFYKDSAKTQPITLNGTTPVEVKTGDLAIGSTTAQEATVTIYWEWAFETANNASDTADTEVGVLARTISEVNFAVSIDVDQID